MKIINFPSRLGQRKKGLENTGSYFKNFVNNNFYNVNCSNSTKHREFHLINNLWNLYHANILFKNKINIGGDHSMSMATVADSLNRSPENKLKVIWFDAHPDINTYKSSNTKSFHGMPLSFLTGIDEDEDLSFIVNKLKFDNLMYVGLRSVDRFESRILNKYEIKHLNVNTINNNPQKSYRMIKNFIKDDPVHLSFDVDVLDPSIMPCTGTPVDKGLKLDPTKIVLDHLKNDNIVNMDITELNLELGNEKEKNESIKNILYLFDNYFDVK
jgi:arginase